MNPMSHARPRISRLSRRGASHSNGAPTARSGQLLQALPVAAYTCDAHGRVTEFNDAAVALWGRAPELGTEVWCGSYRLYRSDGSPMSHESSPMARTVLEGQPILGEEIVIERPDGTRRHVMPHPQILRDDQGRLAGAVNMLVDLTEQRRNETELAAVRDDLKHRVAGMDAMHDLSMYLAHPLELSTSLEAVLHTLTRIHGADHGLLLVHNPAPSAEAVELDLLPFRGAVPVELLGGSRFPAVGDRPYTLTLAPHGAYWLRLDRPGRPAEAYGIERDSI